jgi:hypothetical protein
MGRMPSSVRESHHRRAVGAGTFNEEQKKKVGHASTHAEDGVDVPAS